MSDKHHSLAEHLPHVGLRKLKSLLAIFLGFWVLQLIRIFFPALEVHPIYIYIYGLIEIRDSSEKTKDFGKARIKCTFTAIGTGLPFLALLSWLQGMFTQNWIHIGLELTLLLLGVLLTLIIAEKVGCKTLCGLSAAIFIIFMVSHNNDERYLYSILRAFQTIIGVFIAWLINVKWFPYPGKRKTS